MLQTITQALNNAEMEVMAATSQALSRNSSASSLCHQFADLQAIADYSLSDELTSLCRSEEGRVECILGSAPTIEEIAQKYGHENAQALLTILFGTFFEKSFPSDNISLASLEELVKDVYAECSWMKISDFNLFFYFVRHGEFGDRYGVHLTIYMLTCLNKFKLKRNEILNEHYMEEERQKREESRKGAVSFETYQSMNPEEAQRTEEFIANHKAAYYGSPKKTEGNQKEGG